MGRPTNGWVAGGLVGRHLPQRLYVSKAGRKFGKGVTLGVERAGFKAARRAAPYAKKGAKVAGSVAFGVGKKVAVGIAGRIRDWRLRKSAEPMKRPAGGIYKAFPKG
jgi:hypothetical protein